MLQEQKDFYEKNGYVLIKGNVPHDLLDQLCSRFISICAGTITDYSTRIIKNPYLKSKGLQGQYVVNKFQDFLYDANFWEYASNQNVVDIVESIIGSDITAVNSMLINKPPDSDSNFSVHPLHQDLQYFPFRPASKIVASWTAMEKVDEQNGCLYVVPRSHLDGILYPHQTSKHKLYHGVQGMEHLPRLSLIMEKGDTVFFHPLLLHGSWSNVTKGFRKSISCHYANSNCTFIDVRGTGQEYLAKEVEDVALRLGANLCFVDIWKMKSRLVRGSPGNFQKLDSHL